MKFLNAFLKYLKSIRWNTLKAYIYFQSILFHSKENFLQNKKKRIKILIPSHTLIRNTLFYTYLIKKKEFIQKILPKKEKKNSTSLKIFIPRRSLKFGGGEAKPSTSNIYSIKQIN